MSRIATLARGCFVSVLLELLLVCPNTAATSPLSLHGVRFWAYQIQDQDVEANFRKLVDSRYDMLVIDETRSLVQKTSYDMKAAIGLLHSSLGSSHRGKLVLAYMDIGEAENYRWYWQSGWNVGNPDWIVAPDPDGWEGNHPVLFWRQSWKTIVFGTQYSYLDLVLADEFDGIYLDWIEAAAFEPVVSGAIREKKDPRAEMITFVSELATYARTQKPNFLVIPQNALDLAQQSDAITDQYLSTIDGIAQEAIWFDGSSDQSQQQSDLPSDYTAEALQDLAVFQAAGKPIFTVDYAEQPEHVAYAYEQAAARGFHEYVTLRQLDKLTSTPPPSYPIPEFEQTTLVLASVVLIAIVSTRKHASSLGAEPTNKVSRDPNRHVCAGPDADS